MTVKIDGEREMMAKLAKVAADVRAGSAAAAYGAANIVMTEAKQRAPLDKGDLRGGGYVTPASTSMRGTANVEMGFGGAAEDYAVVQHEDSSLQHDVGEDHYLRNAITATEKDVRDHMRATMRLAIQGKRPQANRAHPGNPNEGG